MSNNALKVNCLFRAYRKTLQSGIQLVPHGVVIRLKRIYNFLCFMHVLHQLLCVLFTLRGNFYAFSRTNLLTRCHSANSLFSVVFVFQKSYIGHILGIGRNEAQSSYFPDTRRSPKETRRAARGWPHHRLARAHPWPRH
jgi:hypothetical protein